MLPPPTPPHPTLKPKNRWKPALAFLVVFLGFGIYSKINPPTKSTSQTVVTSTTTSDWLLAHADAIMPFLDSARVHATTLGQSTTPDEMSNACADMLPLVNNMYSASWKNDSGAPNSWAAYLDETRTALTRGTQGDFTTAGNHLETARLHLSTFTDVVRINTP